MTYAHGNLARVREQPEKTRVPGCSLRATAAVCCAARVYFCEQQQPLAQTHVLLRATAAVCCAAARRVCRIRAYPICNLRARAYSAFSARALAQRACSLTARVRSSPISTAQDAVQSAAAPAELDRVRIELQERLAIAEARHEQSEVNHHKTEALLLQELARLRLTCGFLAAKEAQRTLGGACEAVAQVPIVGPMLATGCMPLMQIGKMVLAAPVIGSGPEKGLYRVVLALGIAFSMLSVVTSAIDMVSSRVTITDFDIKTEAPFVFPEFEVRYELLLSNQPPLVHFVYQMGTLNDTHPTAEQPSWSNVFCSTCNDMPATTRLGTAFYTTTKQPDINVIEETGPWIGAEFTMNGTMLRRQNMYIEDVTLELCATGALGPMTEYLCEAVYASWQISTKPDVSQFKPMSPQDIMGQVFYINVGLFVPEPNITEEQFDAFDAGMYFMSGIPASALFGDYQTWQTIGSTTFNSSRGVKTIAEVMGEELQRYNPLMKATIELADGTIFNVGQLL